MYHLRETEGRKQPIYQKEEKSGSTSKTVPAVENSMSNLQVPALSAQVATVCHCCLSTKDLRSIIKPYMFHGKNENYSVMLATSFIPGLVSDDGLICSDCVRRLRASLSFRQCVESAKKYLQSQDFASRLAKETSTVKQEPPKTNKKIPPVNTTNTKIFKETAKKPVAEDSSDESDSYSMSNDDQFSDYILPEDVSQQAIPQPEICPAIPEPKPEENEKIPEENPQDSESSSTEEDFEEFFGAATETPRNTFSRTEFDVGEQRTLPYVLDNTDRTCEICHREFSFFGELLKHMPEHYPNHICDICGKICATRKSLIFHAKTHTDVRLDCSMCDKSFKNKSNLNAHVKVQHKGEKILFKCSLCGEFLNTYNARIKHLAEKHGREDKAYKCMQCSCKYRLGSHLRAHVRRVHLQEKNHRCHECGLSFFTRKCLENHNIKHSGERNFSCSVCNKSYGRKESLRQHVKTHEIDKGFPPDNNFMRMPDERDFNRQNTENFPSHICDVCGKVCQNRKSLSAHTRTHSAVRVDCEHCEKSFKSNAKLTEHVKVHHRGEKLFFKCPLCGELLKTYNSRKIHLVQHHGYEDKAYKCNQCSCKYRLSSHLRAHIRRVHLQEKNHKCQECNRSFFTRYCLDTHARKHSGERIFQCGTCNKTYYRKQSLREHLKTHEE